MRNSAYRNTPNGATEATGLSLVGIEIHRDEILADWQLAVNGEEVFRIEPLK